MIYYIKHIDIEGPGTLGDFFKEKGFESKTISLEDGDPLPDVTDNITAIIGLGGPMNVYEEEKYPYLTKENEFIQKAIDNNIPYLGLCLGSQLLSKAAGGKVTKSPEKEIGFFPVELTEEGRSDALFKGIESPLLSFQWHEDMSEPPLEATVLAESKACPIQAFKLGQNAYALQFHVEITDLSIREWTDKYVKNKPECEAMKEDMLKIYKEQKEQFDKAANVLYENFLNIIYETSPRTV